MLLGVITVAFIAFGAVALIGVNGRV